MSLISLAVICNAVCFILLALAMLRQNKSNELLLERINLLEKDLDMVHDFLEKQNDNYI